MSLYAGELDDNNLVIRAIVCESVEWATENLGGVWVGSDTKIGIGHTYDEERDAFIPPKPFESWVLDEDTCLWVAPVPYPADGGAYVWDEDAGDWVSVDV